MEQPIRSYRSRCAWLCGCRGPGRCRVPSGPWWPIQAISGRRQSERNWTCVDLLFFRGGFVVVAVLEGNHAFADAIEIEALVGKQADAGADHGAGAIGRQRAEQHGVVAQMAEGER